MAAGAGLAVFALCLAGAAAADSFNFANEAHRGHYVTIEYSAIGDLLSYDEEGRKAIPGQSRNGEIYIHVSPTGDAFLFFGECEYGAFENIVRNGNGIELSAPKRLFDIDCTPGADTEGGDPFRTAGGSVVVDTDDTSMRLTIMSMRSSRITPYGDTLVSTVRSGLKFSISFGRGEYGQRPCRIDELSAVESETWQRTDETGETVRAQGDSLWSGTLHRQDACREIASPFPPPPGTGKPIPPTPHATP